MNERYGISVIIKATGMSRQNIVDEITAGRITAAQQGRLYKFTAEEKVRLESLHNSYIGFFALVRDMDHGNERFSLRRKPCRDELIEFMDSNNWFGTVPMSAEDVFFTDTTGETWFVLRSETRKLEAPMMFWISSYGMSSSEKRDLLLDRLRTSFPVAGAMLKALARKEYAEDPSAVWKTADFLCVRLDADIDRCDSEKIEYLVQAADAELPLLSARIFEELLRKASSKCKASNIPLYHFQSRGTARRTDAYPAEDMLRMAYIVFNEQAWQEYGLVEKAMSDERMANCWLFVAFHFICGWRGSDILRIPMPTLNADGSKLRTRLYKNRLDTEPFIAELEHRLRYASMKPNKTKPYGVADLKLFIPYSLRKPLGFIYVLAASFHNDLAPGEPFMRRAGSYEEIKQLFGTEFLLLCEKHGFSSRRMNKSYLQGIENAAENTPGSPKGYMLAALARSHKGGYGALPKTTEIYLRDARFSGYSPEFIAKEMLERGVFSFIPALLLDMYDASIYRRLSVPETTKLINEIGIEAQGLENTADLVRKAVASAHHAIAGIMRRPENIKGGVYELLQNIASGNAPGRQDGMLCLMTAAGFACCEPGRTCCIGCGYEIYTLTVLKELVNEYLRLLSLRKSSTGEDGTRYEKLLRCAVLPTICEIIAAARCLYPKQDMSALLKIVEGGILPC